MHGESVCDYNLSRMLLSLVNLRELHDTGLCVANGLELSPERFGLFTIDGGDIEDSIELVEAGGLIFTHGIPKCRVSLVVNAPAAIGIVLVYHETETFPRIDGGIQINLA